MIKHYSLTLEASSTEGIHDFVHMLEAVIDDIKSGLEKNETAGMRPDGYKVYTKWRIDPKMQEHGE